MIMNTPQIQDFAGKRIHMIGIGGSSMSGLAQMLQHLGYQVTGSDQNDGYLMNDVRQAGAKVTIGHRAENVHGADLVVYTAAIPPTNPERAEAERLHIPSMERAELLGQLLSTDEGACHIGEVALVPASSPINRSGALFYNTLFDENAACHIAFGASYPGTTQNGTTLSKEELLARGMNQSSIHEDVMIGAEDSKITGKCRDGRTVTLFENGVWVL